MPFHLFFLIIFALNFLPEIGFHCRETINFPLMLFLMELAFVMIIIAIWILHCMNWTISWSEEGLDYRQKHILQMFRI